MDDKERKDRQARITPYLPSLRNNEEPNITNKQQLLLLMQDLKDEGNILFKEESYLNAWKHYCFALFAARQLERTFYCHVEKEFLATLFCNASLCSLRTENYEFALKDADMALHCQPNNIKAMYRRAVALKELGRYDESLTQAQKGQQLDTKNNFSTLIDELKELQKKSSAKGKDTKNTTSSEASTEWLEGTNAVTNKKKKNMSSKNTKKKKGGQPQPQPQAAKTAAPAAPAKRSSVVAEDVDSDSTDGDGSDNDSQFATRMMNIKRQDATKKPAANHGVVPNRAATPAGAEEDERHKTIFNQVSEPDNSRTDGFTTARARPSQVRRQSFSLHWPLELYEFCLACKYCFVKQEGVGGYKYRDNYPHNCSHDTLIVRDKARPHLDWMKIRPRISGENSSQLYKYQICKHFMTNQPCRVGELNCMFAHNHTEVTLWNLDRDRVFNIQGFINDAKRQGITSSKDLPVDVAKPVEVRQERYIPGLNFAHSGAKRLATPPPSGAQPPPLQFPGRENHFSSSFNNTTKPTNTNFGGVSGLSDFGAPPPTSTATNQPHYASETSRTFQQPPPSHSKSSQSQSFGQFSGFTRPPGQPAFNVPPPEPQTAFRKPLLPTFQQPTPPPIFSSQAPPPFKFSNQGPSPPKFNNQEPPPKTSGPSFSPQMPNFNHPPPSHGKLANPFPGYKLQLFCPQCLTYTGKPWFYFQYNVPHLCLENVLAFFVQNDLRQNCWVKARERTSHRSFKGNYILCQSLTSGNIELCKFRENCSFAHNVLEQRIWKLEQEGKFDVAEFILQNKKQNTSSSSSGAGFQMPAVKNLLDKHGGYFRFICRECFFAPRPMISSIGTGNTCTGAARHQWDKSRIIAHVKNTTFTPIDNRKFHHTGAFYLMCNFMHFCKHWLANKCRFAHSLVEREVWMLERDTCITRDELVTLSINIFQGSPSQGQPQPPPSGPTQAPPSGGAPWGARAAEPPRPSTASTPMAETQTFGESPSLNLGEFCRTCWGKGQRSKEDGKKDKCVRGHSNFKLNSVFVALPSGKEIRSLAGVLRPGMKPVLCMNYPKCTRPICTHPHGQEELDIWMYMMKHQIKTLRDLCNHIQETQKSKTRKISVGESVVSVWGQSGVPMSNQSKPANQIIAPGDLVINELYCSYCGISCNSPRQWDEHCMSERHVNNVNSDKEHQWNFRQPPWGQGSNLALCAKHIHNQSCQYSHVPDMYNLCKYAHSQEELDEWLERFEWRQLKREVAKERHMFSYTESLLEEYYSKDNSVSIISETLPGVSIVCNEEQVLYKNEKNAVFTWTFEIRCQKTMEKVALLHNKDRLHFSLLGVDDTRHQVASGDLFLTVDGRGNACYKVNVSFSGGMFGSFSQWVVFDFGERPVLVKKLAVEIGDHLQHERVKELRQDLAFDRWTSLNREIQRAPDETLDEFTVQLLYRYKEPSASEDVITMDSLTELNRHNYVHKMHKLLELEEITRHRMIADYNLVSVVTASDTLVEPGIVLRATNGDIFIKVMLSENLTEDTLSGKLILTSVRTILLAPVNSKSKQVYEATIVGENNYGLHNGYDGRGREYIYFFVNAKTAAALGLSPAKQTELEIQFQMDRKFFCRMHYALDSLQSNDVIFPDVVKFKPDINQLASSLKIRSNVLNDDQMTAVRHIVTKRDGYTPPFIMYGPFGTGKTETLAQATMSLLKERPDIRILICTQSNSAADLYITKHLDNFFKKHQGKLKMFRLNAEERRKNAVPAEVLPYCYSPKGNKFEYPDKDYILLQNLVLTTVENSMQLTKLGIHNFFTHIFIDEAGQTLECEILMPLTLAGPKTCVVLTGDHHQIGPMVYSQEARRQKFDMSILVRLYNYYEQIANCGMSQITEKSQQSPLNIFLSINYRTKTEILRFISSVFYGGPDNLKAYGQIPAVMGITPLMFYAVQGVETQHADSTSYLNHAEAQEILERVKELVDNWPQEWGEFHANKLAVIAFYSDQIKHIRKMFRQDKQRPYLREVDIGPVHSFQGKEVRALFISTVRTSNLLEERHFIRSLENGEDIGDLGFLSNPKLLNTALTRTQSFVAVVGDPVALCLIGECIQVWRTYLKHCSNMKSVRPMNMTYEFVRNQVVHIQVGPAGRVVDMITKRSQDNFKQSLQGKSTKARVSSRNQQADMPAMGDAVSNTLPAASAADENNAVGNLPAGWMTPGFSNQTLPKLKPGITAENRQNLRQFSHDNLSLSSNISCEDIIFQLAKENQTSEQLGQTSLIKSEGIMISEENGFAVLRYNAQSINKREPFTLTSEDQDFIAFVATDGEGKTVEYENWGIDTLNTKLEEEPEEYVKCTLHVEKTRAYASIVGPVPPPLQTLGNINHEIEILGQLNRGHAFTGDVVVVQLLGYLENMRLMGQVKGILKRSLDPNNRLFVCTADAENTGFVTPINADLPRIYCLTSPERMKLARKGNVCVYKFTSSSGIEFSHYEPVDAINKTNRLFIVRYLTWEPGFVLPLGVVVGMLNADDSLEKGMQVLEIEHNIKRALRPQAMDELDQLYPQFSLPAHLLQNRHNLTQSFCFTISSPDTEDLEMAISVSEVNGGYEVGVHVTDIVAYVEKDSVLDQECEHRGGASLFPLGREAKHMLPAPMSVDYCSLKPGLDRLAISVIIKVTEQGQVFGQADIFRSIINSHQRFSHTEVEEIILNSDDAQSDYIKSCISVLYGLSYAWRYERLGNGHVFPDLSPGEHMFLHSHLMLNEVKIRFNAVVAELLLSRFEETTPLLVQPAPQTERLEEWKRSYASHAFNSIPMTKAFLEDKVCRCNRACTCVFSYMRKHHLKNGDYVTVLKDRWLMVCEAVGGDCMDFELAQELISNPENMPQIAVASHKLKAIQQPEKYICSQDTSEQDRKHYGLSVSAYTNFTSPLRKFISMVVQRLLVAYIEGSPSPYGSVEIEDICAQATTTEADVDRFSQAMFVMQLASAVKAHPVALNGLVEEVNHQKAVISFEGITGLPQEQRTITLSLLSPSMVTSQEQKSDSVQLVWKERVYEHAVTDNQAEPSSELKLYSDRFVCSISSLQWQRLLIAAREKDEAAMATCVQEITKLIGGEMELLSKKYPEVLSDIGRDGRVRHFVPFSFTLHESQMLGVQLSARVSQGLLVPSVQLLNLTSCLDICLEHKAEPSSCFSKSSLAKETKSKATYTDEMKYASEYLLPVLSLESAHRAVEEENRITVHSINISWRTNPNVILGDVIEGSFVLSEEFCSRSSFQPDLVSPLLDGRPLPSDDPTFCMDYLCVRYSLLPSHIEPSLHDSVSVLVNNGQPVTWVGHCWVTAIAKSPEGHKVKAVVIKSNMKMPEELLDKHYTTLCTIEWIRKAWDLRVIDVAVRGFQYASQFAKGIVTGKKPFNTIDPVQQDNSIFKNTMSDEQEAVMAECYRQPVTAVLGGPGTGKSQLAARLALLVVARNRTADAFRQIRLDGYTTQLMLCAPTETSLDVVTEYLIKFNYTGIHIVRVYSEEIEERDFPVSHSTKASMSAKPAPSLPVMKNVALHHLIRGKDNSESKSLLEQEMMTMYGKQMATAVDAAIRKAQTLEIKKAQIILCTCITSARSILRQTANIKQIILDDAGFISEAEAIVPLVMHRSVNQLVLIGDLEMPEANIKDPLASQLGLSQSLLQRYSERAQKLTMQYRCSSTLCSYPSNRFYKSSLQTTSSQSYLLSPAPTIPWPGDAGFPSVFCHVAGHESIPEGLQGTCSSENDIVNVEESDAVVTLIGALTQKHKVNVKSLLVLTMTRAQAALIRDNLPPSVAVSTVLDSIGQEAEYVILSTVRALPDTEIQRPPTSKWTKAHFGQLANPRVVNLALTRVKTALFVVGNKDLLENCDPWISFLVTYRARHSIQTDIRDFLQSLLLVA